MGFNLIKYLTFIFIVFSIFIPQQVLSNENFNLPKTLVNPESFLYPIKRLSENILLKFNFSSDSIFKFHRNLTKVRLAELKHVAEKRLLSHIEKPSQRLAYQTGIYTQNVISKKSDDDAKEVLKDFEDYKKVLVVLRDLYEANSSYWILIQQDIDTFDLNADKLKK